MGIASLTLRRAGVLLGAAMVLAACSDDDAESLVSEEPGAGTPVTFRGILAGSGLSGDIEITIAGSAAARVSSGGPLAFSVRGARVVVAVSGCLYIGSSTCSTVSGTYDTSTRQLTFTVSNPALTFTGTYTNGTIEGTFTGGGGSGVFVVHSGSVEVFCGTYTGSSDGIWNLSLTDNRLEGAYNDVDGDSGRLSGTLSGSSVSITFTGGSASGTRSGTTMSGTWQTLDGDAGTWSGSTAGCRG
jgi:hypothetical protein